MIDLLLNHEMSSLEPNSFMSDASSAKALLLRLISPSLVRVDAARSLQPDLAESWTVESDARVFRFKLRDDVRFHDGTPLDASVVAWNVRRIQDPRFNSTTIADFAGLVDVRAVGSNSVVFEFAEPYPAFPYVLPWSFHLVAPATMQPVGAGPFKLVEWLRGSQVRLAPHEDYHVDGLPFSDGIRATFVPHSEERMERIRSGRFDVIESAPASQAKELRRSGMLEYASVQSSRRMTIVFGSGRPPFQDIRLRQDVAHAVDRGAIREQVWGDHCQPVDGLYPAASPWYADLEPIDYDPDRARSLLRQAGIRELVVDRAISTSVAPTSKIAELVAAQLAEVGIHLKLTFFEDPPWWPWIYKGYDWQMAFQNFPERPHPEAMIRKDLGTGGFFNGGGYSNQALDDLLRKARSHADLESQRRAYAQAQEIIHRDLPELPIAAPDVVIGWRPGMTGVSPHPMQYVDLAEAVYA